MRKKHNNNYNGLILSLGPSKANLCCPVTGASDVFFAANSLWPAATPRALPWKTALFFFIGTLLSHWPFDAGRETGLSPSPKSIFATITQKQEEMANWRVVARLMMQYNGHLPIQKQTNGHILNTIWAWPFTHKHKNTWIEGCFEADLWKGCSMSQLSLVSRWEAESDSPQALAAKSCLGHLALT